MLAAKRLGAEQIVLMGRHQARTDLGREFGATDVVAERGEEGIAKVRELTGGHGTHTVLECVGHMPAYEQAVGVVRAGGVISRVGVPQYEEAPVGMGTLFGRNITLTGGPGAQRLHRGTAARRPRGPHRAGPGLRPHRRPRRRPRRLPRDGRPRGAQGPRPSLSAGEDDMELLPKQPTVQGPAELFTGDVWFDVIAPGEAPSRVRVNTVRFAPCARTAWHCARRWARPCT